MRFIPQQYILKETFHRQNYEAPRFFLDGNGRSYVSGSAFACSVPNSASEKTRELVKQQGGWPISDAKCNFLNKNNLHLDVTLGRTVLSGISVGWAVVSLADRNKTTSDQHSTGTYVDRTEASMNIADELAFTALQDAIKELDFEKAAKEIAAYKKAAKGQ